MEAEATGAARSCRKLMALPVVKTRVTSIIRELQVRVLPARKIGRGSIGRASECTLVAGSPAESQSKCALEVRGANRMNEFGAGIVNTLLLFEQ